MMAVVTRRCIALLFVLLWPAFCRAWVPANCNQVSHRVKTRPINAFSSPKKEILFQSRRMVKIDNESSEKEKSLQTKFQKFVLALGRGILFAKPIGPTVSQALFGVKSRRKNDKKAAANSRLSFTLREGLIAISIYLVIGVAFYSIMVEHWSIIDSIYYSIVLFTTVGYGDIVTQTGVAKIFTCFFSLGGIAILAAALASIGSNIVETELKAVRVAKKVTQRNVLTGLKRVVHRKQQIADNCNVTAVVPFQKPAVTLEAPTPPPKISLLQVCMQLMPRLLFLVAGGLAFGRLEGWSAIDSIYYALITAGTVGLGDFSPSTQKTRLLAAFFIPLAVAAGGEILGTIASAFLQRRRAQLFDNMVNNDFSMDHIKEMDSDGDGQVSRLEYLEFMLIEMNLVEKSVIEELQSQFDRLDMTKGGSLSKEDLILMAKMRRRKHQEESEATGLNSL